MAKIITDNIGQVKLGNTVLPGIFESLEVNGDVFLDQIEIKGSKKKGTQAAGYDIRKVSLNLKLTNDYERGLGNLPKLQVIEKLFRKSGSQELPLVYKIINKHIQARGISQVVFTRLVSRDTNENDVIIVTLEFIEYVPVLVKITSKVLPEDTKAKKKKKAKTPATDIYEAPPVPKKG